MLIAYQYAQGYIKFVVRSVFEGSEVRNTALLPGFQGRNNEPQTFVAPYLITHETFRMEEKNIFDKN
jgi:hypothetical protein